MMVKINPQPQHFLNFITRKLCRRPKTSCLFGFSILILSCLAISLNFREKADDTNWLYVDLLKMFEPLSGLPTKEDFQNRAKRFQTFNLVECWLATLKPSVCILQSGCSTQANLHTFHGYVYKVDHPHADRWFTTLCSRLSFCCPIMTFSYYSLLPIFSTHPDSLLWFWLPSGTEIADISDRP